MKQENLWRFQQIRILPDKLTEVPTDYGISVKDNRIVIEGADESIAYWGDSDWNWNLK